jgi:hypothetical protein
MAFFFLLAIPLVLGILGFIVLKTITWREFLAQVGVQLLIAGFSAGVIYSSNTWDTEIWNGYVTGKKKEWVSCSHSYRCRCRSVQSCSGSGKDRSCTTHEECDTCYDHANDWDWEVYTSLNETIDIRRIDRRGSNEPPRWTAVQLNEPTSSEHSYTNYIKAAPDTLFRHQGLTNKYRKILPQYPDQVYDYYRINRLVLVNGARVEDPAAWNLKLSEINAKLGHLKQANMVVVLVKNVPDDFYYALEEAWVGGKKNDIVLVVGVDGQLAPKWSAVMAWTTRELFKIQLRDGIMDLPKLTPEAVIGVMGKTVQQAYKRKPMAEFEYLQASITPTTTQWVVSMIFGLMVAFGLIYALHKHDLFQGERRW